jgi:hypothetical protein
MIYTFPIDPSHPFSGNTRAIAALPWDNPQYGPYPILSFNEVPDNVIPASPAAHLSAMARIINNVMRKQSRRARGQKDVGTYTPSGAKDAERLKRAGDQEWIAVQEQSEVNVMKFGGPDQLLQAYTVGMLQMYDRMAGNLSAMAGLGNQAPTLGQEEMIQGAVSKKEAAMQYRVVDFAVTIVRQLGYMLWNDKSNIIPGSYTPQGLEDYEPVDETWTPFDREGDFNDYNLGIDVYSMPYQSPASKFQTLMSLLQNVFVPAGSMLTQQGGAIDYKKVAEIGAELLDMPQLQEIITFNAGFTSEQSGPDEQRMPTSTSREYVRRNVPSGGSPNTRAVMEQQAWLSSPQEQSTEMGQ